MDKRTKQVRELLQQLKESTGYYDVNAIKTPLTGNTPSTSRMPLAQIQEDANRVPTPTVPTGPTGPTGPQLQKTEVGIGSR